MREGDIMRVDEPLCLRFSGRVSDECDELQMMSMGVDDGRLISM